MSEIVGVRLLHRFAHARAVNTCGQAVGGGVVLRLFERRKFQPYLRARFAGTIPSGKRVFDRRFFRHKFHVYFDEKNKSLIPRSETELIVEEALKYIQKNNSKKILALDVGTGSCCIPISIIMNSSRNIIFDSIDPHTYKIAQKNILENSLNNLISLYEYEIDDILTNLNKKYDIVTANLPYISDRNAIKELRFEPDKALYAKDNGSFFIKKLVKIIPKILTTDGIVILEIDPSLTNYFENLKKYNIKIIKDLNDFNRVVLLSLK